ncbi:hypothetical protein HBI56_040790 [Parastagonospora nodorum]|uniref:Uncharacterized protein n=1 Tax=Phaeosphaeria nodorum (strain SN15 / ATCC MYA-4574 / FGSC 10173) TaxID=321614 RepID=A0A7U2EUF8_PHANO|nr:hypothetical protein HBH56_065970 [Parastagonospora nodorum]QRC93308.1 hypothetical protein JI435_035470 [Parastagonospora nodorum SN15]KAH3932393.1 hypothetical protein HBH54_082120 [Parastagonospora nodorum]KAH3955166.1 hypothetical protein HBH53_012270 [Parastagonospora nodorum]KAH3986594.1 hypothetical protein HBH52_043470 [Parastagonospora nodorum]
MKPRPACMSLAISTPAWRAPRPATPRRATFPLPGTTSTSSLPDIAGTPPVPALSYWLPETPSPLSSTAPSSPVNQFLLPLPSEPLFSIASPLLPASPLSMFDYSMSPGFTVSPMSSTFGIGAMSPVSPTFLFSRTPTPTTVTFAKLSSPTARSFLLPMSPLSPRFMYPRTPPAPRQMDVKTRQKSSIQEAISTSPGRKESVQHALEELMDRKASIASVLSMGQQRMTMKINFYQWLAVRRWEGMEKDEKSRWGRWRAKKVQGFWKRMVGQKREHEEKQTPERSRIKVLRDAEACL